MVNETGFSGAKVISFESRRAFEMQSLIERHGGLPFVAPTLREIPFELNREAFEFAKRVLEGKVDITVWMTGVGTRFVFQVAQKTVPFQQFLSHLSKITIVSRGPKPTLALKEVGLVPTVQVPEPNTWREIISVLDQKMEIRDKKVFIQEYGIENREFIQELKKRKAHVSRVPVYRWSLPEDITPIHTAISNILEGTADILLFTNATQIYHLLQVAAENGLESSLRESLDRVVLASIGPIVTENLKECGFPSDFESSQSKMGLFVKESAEACPSILQEKRKRWDESRKKIVVPTYTVKPYSQEKCQESPFLKACRYEPTPYTPIWLMRQAGRYMKEYRDIRSKVSFLELCKNSDLCCEVTVHAQEKLGVDAAILFSDILLILEPLGVPLQYTKGDGPTIFRPIRTTEDVENLKTVHPKESLSFVMDAIRKTRSTLKPEIPLIGLSGAPFTIVSYMIEGKSSENYLFTKLMMYQNKEAWNQLMEKVTTSTIEFILTQVEAGVQTVQIFDSWVGCLSPQDYSNYVLPHMKRLFQSLPSQVPFIHFGTCTGSLLELLQEAGGSVFGIDWRTPLENARKRLGKVPLQGNLDPLVILSDIPTIRNQVKKILEPLKGESGHIFNLGHGVLPQTPVENVQALVDIVHELTSK